MKLSLISWDRVFDDLQKVYFCVAGENAFEIVITHRGAYNENDELNIETGTGANITVIEANDTHAPELMEKIRGILEQAAECVGAYWGDYMLPTDGEKQELSADYYTCADDVKQAFCEILETIAAA